MLKHCQQCNKEFESKRADAIFCSAKCRKDKERGVTDNFVTDNQGVLVTDKFKEITVSLEEVCTPDEIRDYPAYCQTRKEYKESVYRLQNNDIEKLRKAGYFIPNAYDPKTKHSQ